MKAFVTGATGLLGNNLVRALRAYGHEVRALVRSDTKAQQLLGDTGAELVLGDMEDVPGFAETLAGCDVVFHTAAYFREYYASGDHWPKLERINVQGTLALAEAADARGVRRLVHTSSSATIGLRADRSAGDEDTPPAPIAAENLYFRSKVIADQKLRELSARLGLDVVQVLPGWMFGPWDAAPTASGRLVLDFLAGALPPIPPGGMNAVDARDVAAGMIRAAVHGRTGHRYILGGPFVTLADVAETLAHLTGLPAPRFRVPYRVAWAYATFAEAWARITGGQTLVTVAAVRAMHAQLRVSSHKALRELRWRYRPLSHTLRDEVAWYRAHGMASQPAIGGALAAMNRIVERGADVEGEGVVRGTHG
jgi:dihydroflavonol-4-reductase